jgi:hypothetical protein
MLCLALARLSLALCVCISFAVAAAAEPAAPTVTPNVLFIIADDASCHFGAYGCSCRLTNGKRLKARA